MNRTRIVKKPSSKYAALLAPNYRRARFVLGALSLSAGLMACGGMEENFEPAEVGDEEVEEQIDEGGYYLTTADGEETFVPFDSVGLEDANGEAFIPEVDIEAISDTEYLKHKIVGSDNRFQVPAPWNRLFPYSTIAQLIAGNAGCSGTLFGPRHLVTAAHCLHTGTRRGRHLRPVTVTPGQAGPCAVAGNCPFGTVGETARIVSGRWRRGIRKRWRDDWAIVILNQRVGDTAGFMGFRDLGRSGLQDARLTTFGYPGDRPFGTMWGQNRCPTGAVMARTVRHDCDTAGGQSGSGMWANGAVIAAVHNMELAINNRAIRVQGSLLQAMRNALRDFP